MAFALHNAVFGVVGFLHAFPSYWLPVIYIAFTIDLLDIAFWCVWWWRVGRLLNNIGRISPALFPPPGTFSIRATAWRDVQMCTGMQKIIIMLQWMIENSEVICFWGKWRLFLLISYTICTYSLKLCVLIISDCKVTAYRSAQIISVLSNLTWKML
jgi:hypothetical protein